MVFLGSLEQVAVTTSIELFLHWEVPGTSVLSGPSFFLTTGSMKLLGAKGIAMNGARTLLGPLRHHHPLGPPRRRRRLCATSDPMPPPWGPLRTENLRGLGRAAVAERDLLRGGQGAPSPAAEGAQRDLPLAQAMAASSKRFPRPLRVRRTNFPWLSSGVGRTPTVRLEALVGRRGG